MDDKERIRGFLNLQYTKIITLAAVGSIILLAFNLALSIFSYMEFRFPKYIFFIPSAWLGVASIFILIMLIIWISAHIYVRVFEMYRTEKSAEMMFNPYGIYAFSPFQEAWFRNYHLPILKALAKEHPDDQELKDALQKVERWLHLGYIPKDEYPEDLKKYYITKIQRRV